MRKRILIALLLALPLASHWLPLITASPASFGWIATFKTLSPALAGDSLAIVVNKNNPAEGLSLHELRSLLLAEQRNWSNGRRVTIVMREPGQPDRAALLKAACRMTDGDYTKYFLQLQFGGDLQAAPKILSTEAGVRKFIFNVPGAIGYLRTSDVDDTVKVLRIDGRLPGEPGYKLRLDS